MSFLQPMGPGMPEHGRAVVPIVLLIWSLACLSIGFALAYSASAWVRWSTIALLASLGSWAARMVWQSVHQPKPHPNEATNFANEHGTAIGTTLGALPEDTTPSHREHARHLASAVINTTADAVVVSDAVDRIVMVNPAFVDMTGLTVSEVMGRNAELFGMQPLRESHLPGITPTLQEGQRWTGESQQICQDGRVIDTWLHVGTLHNPSGRLTQHIRVFTDVSVLKNKQRELAEQASQDTLTGLPNRRAFGERLDQAMARAHRSPQTLAVLYVDLDGFKMVNDRHGHAAGDQLLVDVAKRLLTCVRLTDCVCRLAGDEFTVILEGAGHPQEVLRIGHRIIERLSQPHLFDGDAMVVTPSIGAALYEVGEGADSLCRRADQAMYVAKKAGKGCLRLFDSQTLHHSLADNQLIARYGS